MEIEEKPGVPAILKFDGDASKIRAIIMLGSGGDRCFDLRVIGASH